MVAGIVLPDIQPAPSVGTDRRERNGQRGPQLSRTRPIPRGQRCSKRDLDIKSISFVGAIRSHATII